MCKCLACIENEESLEDETGDIFLNITLNCLKLAGSSKVQTSSNFISSSLGHIETILALVSELVCTLKSNCDMASSEIYSVQFSPDVQVISHLRIYLAHFVSNQPSACKILALQNLNEYGGQFNLVFSIILPFGQIQLILLPSSLSNVFRPTICCFPSIMTQNHFHVMFDGKIPQVLLLKPLTLIELHEIGVL